MTFLYANASGIPVATSLSTASSSSSSSSSESTPASVQPLPSLLAEDEVNPLCTGLYADGIVDHDYCVKENISLDIPVLASAPIEEQLKVASSAECYVDMVLGRKIAAMIKTKEFSSLEMLAYLEEKLQGVKKGSIKDIQYVGSAVPWMFSTFPQQISVIKKYWNELLRKSFGREPGDIDIRIYLNDGDEYSLSVVEGHLRHFLIERLDGGVEFTDTEKLWICANLMITNRFVKREYDSSGKIVTEYQVLRITRTGLPPLDIVVVNKLVRPYLATEDSLRLSIRGYVVDANRASSSAQSKLDSRATCQFLEVSPQNVFQAIIDKSSKIFRLGNLDNLSYFTEFPVLLAAYVKGETIIESQGDTEKVLFEGYVKSCEDFKIDYFNRKYWSGKVALRLTATPKEQKYIYFLAKSIMRDCKRFHDATAFARISMTFMVCRLMAIYSPKGHVELLLQEVKRLIEEERNVQPSSSQKVTGFFGALSAIVETDPELIPVMSSWIQLKGLCQQGMGSGYTSRIVRSKAGYGVQIVKDDVHLLLPLDAAKVSMCFIQEYENLNVEQRAQIEKFCTNHAEEGPPTRQRLLGNLGDPKVILKALTLPAPFARLVVYGQMLLNAIPEQAWILENWDKMVGLYNSAKERLWVVRRLQAFYGSSAITVFSALETLLSSPEREYAPIESLKSGVLFSVDGDTQVLLDYQYWEKIRTTMTPAERATLDKTCFDRIVAKRPDRAAEILSAALHDEMLLSSASERINGVVLATAKVIKNRSYKRLKSLLSTVVSLINGKEQFKLSPETAGSVFDLLDCMLQEQCYDEEFAALVVKILNPVKVSLERYIAAVVALLDQTHPLLALEIWAVGGTNGALKEGAAGSWKLVRSAEISAEAMKWYKSLPNVSEDNLSAGEKFLDGAPEELSVDLCNGLVVLLRSPHIDDDVQVLLEYQYWKKARKAMKPAEQAALDKTCFDRILAHRPDRAAEILSVALHEGMSLSSASKGVNAVVIATNKVTQNRNYERLKNLLSTAVSLLNGKEKFKLSTEATESILDLLDCMSQERCYDEQFAALAVKILNPTKVSPERYIAAVVNLLGQGKPLLALEMWAIGITNGVVKGKVEGASGSCMMQLAHSAGVSAEAMKLYKSLLSAPEDNLSAVKQFLDGLVGAPGELSIELWNELVVLLRLPLVVNFLMQNSEKSYFQPIYSKIVTDKLLQTNVDSVKKALTSKLDYVQAILCIGYLKSGAFPEIRHLINLKMVDLIKVLCQHNFLKEAGELLLIALQQKKVLFTKVADAEMLHVIISSSGNFLLFAQYKNLLENLSNKEAYKALEAKAVEWMRQAQLSQWESAFPPTSAARERDEHLSKVLFPYVWRLVLEPMALKGHFAELLKRTIVLFAEVDRRRFYECLDWVEKLCDVHFKDSKEELVQVLSLLFSHMFVSKETPEKSVYDKIWKVRLRLHGRQGLELGQVKAWSRFDQNLAESSARILEESHHNIALTLLLKGKPTALVTHLLCEYLDTLQEGQYEMVLAYMRKVAGEECDFRSVLIHQNLVTILSKDVSQTLNVLTIVFEAKRTERAFDECVCIIYIALGMLNGTSDERKERWITKFVEVFHDVPMGDLTANLLLQRHQEAIEKRILLNDHPNSMLYAFVKMGGTPTSATAEKASLALIEAISTLKDKAEKLTYIHLILSSMNKFKNFSPENLGRLLINVLSLAIELGSVEEVIKATFHINLRVKTSSLFTHPESIELLKKVLGNYGEKWIEELHVLADMVRNIPECHEVCAKRLKVRLKISAQDGGKLLLKLELLILHSLFLKEHVGAAYVRDALISLIEACKEDMSLLLEPILEECFTHDVLPVSCWVVLLDILMRRRDDGMHKKNLPLMVNYISSHVSTLEQRDVNIGFLLYLLQNFSKYIQKEVVELLLHPEFFDHFLKGDKRDGDDWVMCCRHLLQFLVANFHETFAGELKSKWAIYKLELFSVLENATPSPKVQQDLARFRFVNATCTCFVDATEVGRWGSDQEFTKVLGILDEVFTSATLPADMIVIYEHLRCFYTNLPPERKKTVIDKILTWSAKTLEFETLLDGFGMVLGTMDELLAAYFELHTPEEILKATCDWAEHSTMVFGGLLSEPMVEAYNSGHFSPHYEAQYNVFVTKLSVRPKPISLIKFEKILAVYEEKGDKDSVRCFMLSFVQNYHAYLADSYRDKSYGSTELKVISDFLDTLRAHLRKYYSSAYKDFVAPKAPIPSRKGATVSVFDENVEILTGLVFKWVVKLFDRTTSINQDKQNQKLVTNVHRTSQEEMMLLFREMSSSNCESHLLVAYNNLASLQANHASPICDKLYHGMLESLQGIHAIVESPREVEAFAQLFENVCLVERGKVISKKGKDEFTQLLVAVFANKALKERIFYQKTMLYKFIHVVSFSEKDCPAFSSEDIWEGTRQVIEYFEKSKKCAQKEFVLDILVPAGIKPTVIYSKLFGNKVQTFSSDPERYLQFWDQLFHVGQQKDREELIALVYSAYARLLLLPEGLQNCAKTWRSIVTKVIAKGCASEDLRSTKVSRMLAQELTLFKDMCAQGYFDDYLDLYFERVCNIAERWYVHWDAVENRAGFRVLFLEAIELLAKKSGVSDTNHARETMFSAAIKGIAVKDRGNGLVYVKKLFAHWNAIVGTDATVCFQKILEESEKALHQERAVLEDLKKK